MIRIKYEQLFPTASFLNCRIGLETEIEESSNNAEYIRIELDYLKSLVNEFHQKEFPQFYDKGKPTFTYTGEEEQLPVVQSPKKKIAGFDHFANEIRKTPTIEELETYRVLANNTPGMIEIFNEQLEKLKA